MACDFLFMDFAQLPSAGNRRAGAGRLRGERVPGSVAARLFAGDALRDPVGAAANHPVFELLLADEGRSRSPAAQATTESPTAD
jgi:hypothetical protein